MRSEPTEAERRLWQLLRGHRFAGYKFRRQEPIEFYIVDFVCFSERLIIEIDGGQHVENHSDARRDAYLRGQGFRIIRIWNNDLFNNEEGVGEAILNALRPPLPNPSPARGEGLRSDHG
jgi:very-short-patch-repair endonuclease